jgi:predicted MFS family arabinose efflux permease
MTAAARAPRLARIFRLPVAGGFPNLWAAQTVSVFGDQLTLFAVPTLAILGLHAGPFEAGLLAASGWVAWPVLALPAGVWVDRLNRRRVLIACDLIRAAALMAIPLAALTVGVTIPLLLVVNTTAGAASVFFDLAYSANVADLVPAADIPTANARLEASRSTSYVAGPGLAGLLVGALGAANSVILDACSFLVSALLNRRTAVGSIAVAPAAERHFRAELAEGARAVLRVPVVLRITAAAAISNFGLMFARSLLLLFAYRTLRLDPFTAGLALSGAGAGALAGVAACGRLTTALGVGRALILATVFEAASFLLVPVAALTPVPAVVVAAALGLSSFWGLIWNIDAVSVRQVILPVDVQGRVVGIGRVVIFGVIPIGGIVGGFLAQALVGPFGDGALGATIVIGALIGATSGLAFVGPAARPLMAWRFGDPLLGLAPEGVRNADRSLA